MFLLVPAAAIGSFVIGAIAAVAGPLAGRGAYVVRQSRAIAVVSLTIGGIAAASCLLAQQPPLIEGFAAEIQFEIRLPAREPVPDIAGQEFRASLYASSSDNQFVTLDPEGVLLRDGRPSVPGTARLSSRTNGRTLTLTIGDVTLATFELPVPAQPTAADAAWSPWHEPSAEGRDAGAPAPAYEVRYRIVAVTE